MNGLLARWLLAALLSLLVVAGPAAAAKTNPSQLHLGSNGQRVKDIQYLLSGHSPSVYRKTIHPYRGRVDGVYGPATVRAVKAAKYRLGYPMRGVNGRTGKQLFQFLLGKRARPLLWIGRASRRVHAAIAGQSSCSRRVTSLERSQLGVHEVPWGSNDGPRVRVYQGSTGAYRAPWCASFQEWSHINSGLGHIPGRNKAYVPSIVASAHAQANVHALPRPGALVIYLRELWGERVEYYHIGMVERVTKSGFYSIEGNSGDAVRRRFHSTGYRLSVFIWLDCRLATAARPH